VPTHKDPSPGWSSVGLKDETQEEAANSIPPSNHQVSTCRIYNQQKLRSNSFAKRLQYYLTSLIFTIKKYFCHKSG